MTKSRIAAGRGGEIEGFRWRGLEITRLEQFSDAIFAFALALLVVSTDMPRNMDELDSILRAFPAFGLTFAVLVWLWYLHYQFFRRYGLTNPITIVLNGVLMFLILFYVYPLRFLFGGLVEGFTGGGWTFGMDRGSRLLVIYSGGFISVFLMFALLYRQALVHREALDLTAREVAITKAALQANLWLMAIGALSATLAAFGPQWMTAVAGFLYSLIGPVMWWHWRRSERRWASAGKDRRIEDRIAGDDS